MQWAKHDRDREDIDSLFPNGKRLWCHWYKFEVQIWKDQWALKHYRSSKTQMLQNTFYMSNHLDKYLLSCRLVVATFYFKCIHHTQKVSGLVLLCVRGIDFPVSMVFVIDFGPVPTVW